MYTERKQTTIYKVLLPYAARARRIMWGISEPIKLALCSRGRDEKANERRTTLKS